MHYYRAGLIGLAAIFVCAGLARATTYHVASTGSDSNPGSQASPWRTLQKAANTVRAGDVVMVANGTYAGFQVTADGTAAARIVFRAGGSNVVINSRNSSTPDNVNIEGGNYVTVEGFIVNDAPRVGIRAVTATGVVIRGNRIQRSSLDGILTGYTPQIQILDNIVSGSAQEHGIYVSNSNTASDNPVVRGNECFDNNQNGMQFNGDCWENGDGIISGAVIEENIIHHNNWKGFSLISLQNSRICNNLVYENGLSAGAGGIHLADQPNCGKPSNSNVVANNTVYEPRIACIRLTNGSTANKIFNNVLVASSLDRTIADESGGNYIDTVSNIRRTSKSGLFVSSTDYHLATSSPALNVGHTTYQSANAPAVDIDGTGRPQGAKHDAGSYEKAGTPTPVGDTPAAGIVLEQNAPNPFGSTTRIAFGVDANAPARVSLEIFDAAGRRVRALVTDEAVSGQQTVGWDGRDDRGQAVASGVYFYRLTAPHGVVTRRMTLIR